jgi:hypothetical protein
MILNQQLPTFKYKIACPVHQNKKVRAICMKKSCEFDTRLACSDCRAGNHFDHKDYLVLFENI